MKIRKWKKNEKNKTENVGYSVKFFSVVKNKCYFNELLFVMFHIDEEMPFLARTAFSVLFSYLCVFNNAKLKRNDGMF